MPAGVREFRQLGRPQLTYPDGKRILERVSMETGAHLLEVPGNQAIKQIYTTIEEELRNQYSLGYTPDYTDSAPTYRQIHLSTKQKDRIVQTRDGDYAEP